MRTNIFERIGRHIEELETVCGSGHLEHTAVDQRHCWDKRQLYETRNSVEGMGRGLMMHCPGVPVQSAAAQNRLWRACSQAASCHDDLWLDRSNLGDSIHR
jgi:hypothetical protein